MRTPLLAAVLLTGCATTGPSAPPPDAARVQLGQAERAWLDAYDADDRAAMAETLAEGFTIVFPDGTVETRDEVIAGLDPDPGGGGADSATHYTEDRTIRVLGDTAILTGVYVNPGGPGEPDIRMRYTDTWMWIDGRWRVVASHLSHAGD